MLVFKKTQTQWRLSAQRGTIWSRTKYMVNKLIWIMNLGEFRANCTGREGQAINNLPCRGSLQITGPPLSPCLLPLLFFSHYLQSPISSPSFFPVPLSSPSDLCFCCCPSLDFPDRQTLGEVLRVEGKHVFIYSPSLFLSLSPSVFDTHPHSWRW